jgi:nitrate/nitrite-specific signal transduction histidine kinase
MGKSVREAAMKEITVRPMVYKEARECVDSIKEALSVMPEQERELLIEFALSLDKGGITWN